MLARVTAAQLEMDKTPLGQLLDSFVLSELDKQCGWSEGRYDFSHYCEQYGSEVDIDVEDSPGRLAGIEVKAAATVTAKDFTGLSKLAAAVGDRFIGGFVFYDGFDALPFDDKRRALPISALWSPATVSK